MMGAVLPAGSWLAANGANAAPSSAAAPEATERFASLMADSAPVPNTTSVGDSGPSVADRVVTRLDHFGQTFAAQRQTLSSALQEMNGPPRPAQILHVQSVLLQLSVETELISKVVSQGNRVVDGLTKLS